MGTHNQSASIEKSGVKLHDYTIGRTLIAQREVIEAMLKNLSIECEWEDGGFCLYVRIPIQKQHTKWIEDYLSTSEEQALRMWCAPGESISSMLEREAERG